MTKAKVFDIGRDDTWRYYTRREVEAKLGINHASSAISYRVAAGLLPAPLYGPGRRLYWNKREIDKLAKVYASHVDIQQFARMLGCTVGTIYTRRKREDLPKADLYIGGKVYFDREKVERFCMTDAANKPMGQKGLTNAVRTGGFKVEKAFLAEMDRTAKHLGVTRSLMVHMALDQFLNEWSPERQQRRRHVESMAQALEG